MNISTAPDKAAPRDEGSLIKNCDAIMCGLALTSRSRFNIRHSMKYFLR